MNKKILIITPTPTHPQDAGNRARIYRVMAALLKMGNDVHLAFIKRENGDEVSMQALLGHRFHAVEYSQPSARWMRPKEKLKSLGRNLSRFLGKTPVVWRLSAIAHEFCKVNDADSYPYRIDDWFDQQTLPSIRDLHRTEKFDVVIAEYVFFSKYLDAFDTNVAKIIDTHDVLTDRHKLFLRAGKEPEWFSTSMSQEAKGLKRANIIIAIQEHDRVFFEKISGRRSITVGHLLEVSNLYRITSRGNRILFIGSGNRVNVIAIGYFLQHIFSKIKEKLPDATLLLAGRICDSVRDEPGLVKLGVVQHINDVYTEADVVIAPMQFGTGLNIKVIEALGYGMPIVTTPNGANGIEADDRPYLIADGPEQFAQAVVQVCTDSDLAAGMSRGAIAYAELWNKRQLESLKAAISS